MSDLLTRERQKKDMLANLLSSIKGENSINFNSQPTKLEDYEDAPYIMRNIGAEDAFEGEPSDSIHGHNAIIKEMSLTHELDEANVPFGPQDYEYESAKRKEEGKKVKALEKLKSDKAAQDKVLEKEDKKEKEEDLDQLRKAQGEYEQEKKKEEEESEEFKSKLASGLTNVADDYLAGLKGRADEQEERAAAQSKILSKQSDRIGQMAKQRGAALSQMSAAFIHALNRGRSR